MDRAEELAKLRNWVNLHRDELEAHAGEYIAYGEDLFIHDRELATVLAKARASGKVFVVASVPRSPRNLRVLPLHVRSLGGHSWLPVQPVQLTGPTGSFASSMIVDSGADISVVGLDVGRQLGWKPADAEVSQELAGLGGTVSFFARRARIAIDAHEVDAPVAWVQMAGPTELILGRAVVFDAWDITFAQAEERIEFRWRGDA